MNKALRFLAVLLILLVAVSGASAQGTALTYQGYLTRSGAPANDLFSFVFRLLQTSNGAQQGPWLTNQPVAVTNGLFTTVLDFGDYFGEREFALEIRVCPFGSTAGYTILTPTQVIHPVPVAIAANHAGSAAVAGGLSGTLASSGLAGLYPNALSFNSPANSFTGDGSGLTGVNAATLGGLNAASFWRLGGNLGLGGAMQTLGTSDNTALALKVNNATALRFDPAPYAPNVVGGLSAIRPTVIGPGVRGAVVAGGGAPAGPVTGLGAGDYHAVYDSDCVIGGGFGNLVGNGNADVGDAAFATVGGGVFNAAFGYASTVAGGDSNHAGAMGAAVLGGVANQAGNDTSAVVGGRANAANGLGAGILGGRGNTAAGSAASIAGGTSNSVYAANAVITGGHDNTISDFIFSDDVSEGASINGGGFNTIMPMDTFGGGYYSSIGGGYGNRMSGLFGPDSLLHVPGYSVIPGGYSNQVSGSFSLAAGCRANAIHDGCFVWADSTDAEFASTSSNQFVIRASGGVGINTASPAAALDLAGGRWDVTATEGDLRVGNGAYRFKIGVALAGGGAGDVWLRAHGGTGRVFLKTPGGTTIFSNESQSSGVSLAPGGGSWSNLSDRNAKENLEAVNPQAVLDKVAALPLATWNYKSQHSSIRHLGPMAQDFRAAFGLGESETAITTIDADGVALAAIQGLNQKVEELGSELKRSAAENNQLKQRLADLEQQFRQFSTKGIDR